MILDTCYATTIERVEGLPLYLLSGSGGGFVDCMCVPGLLIGWHQVGEDPAPHEF